MSGRPAAAAPVVTASMHRLDAVLNLDHAKEARELLDRQGGVLHRAS